MPCLYHSHMFFGSRYLGIRSQPLPKDVKIPDCLMFFPLTKPTFSIAFCAGWTVEVLETFYMRLKLLKGGEGGVVQEMFQTLIRVFL